MTRNRNTYCARCGTPIPDGDLCDDCAEERTAQRRKGGKR